MSQHPPDFDLPSAARTTGDHLAAQNSWPHCTEYVHPLGWWRLLPPSLLGSTERTEISLTLENLAVIGVGGNSAAALAGDPAAAISLVLSLLPLREVTLRVDVAMTALLSCALAGDPAGILVLAHVLGRAQWCDPHAEELGLSWLDRHIANPLDRQQFAANEAALAAAFYAEEME